eukprot:TRINITY_DN20919_c0_g1_i1.p1 TRINITY_DN20919_c0_g1~~TRINITY_DN20919_c0_g1_i1.p1  ORF type:complete len:229 (+),score=41.45 TRINITY_DN20919_c0_g1_i1:106-792(+)
MMWLDPEGNNASELTDMHAKWSEKGAHEFIPKTINYSGMGANQQSRGPPGASYQRMPGPGMTAGWGGGYGMQMHNWGAASSSQMPPEGTWNLPSAPAMPPSYMGHGTGSATGVSQSTTEAKSYTFLAAWNLATYTSEDLRNDLLEIDFHAERCQDLGNGSFLLTFSEPWHAKSLVVSLDGTGEHLRTQQNELIRMATYSYDTGKWSSEDVPASIKSQVQIPLPAEQLM